MPKRIYKNRYIFETAMRKAFWKTRRPCRGIPCGDPVTIRDKEKLTLILAPPAGRVKELFGWGGGGLDDQRTAVVTVDPTGTNSGVKYGAAQEFERSTILVCLENQHRGALAQCLETLSGRSASNLSGNWSEIY